MQCNGRRPLRRSRSFKVTDFGTNRKVICDFLLLSNTNLPPTLHRFPRLQSVQNDTARVHIRYTAFWAHLTSAHQASLPARQWAHLLQMCTFMVPFIVLDRDISSPASVASQTCRHDADCFLPALIACTYRSSVDVQSAVAHSQFRALYFAAAVRIAVS